MKRNLVFALTLFAVIVAPLSAKDRDDDRTLRTRLTGYNETPLTINTNASGEFKATISEDGTQIHYEETWHDLSSAVTQSHIHFGRPAITGGIVLFLCTNLNNTPASVPAAQPCPTTSPAVDDRLLIVVLPDAVLPVTEMLGNDSKKLPPVGVGPVIVSS